MRYVLHMCCCVMGVLVTGCDWPEDVPFDGFDLPAARYDISGDVDSTIVINGASRCEVESSTVDSDELIGRYYEDYARLVGEMRTGRDSFVLELTWEPVGESLLGECHGSDEVYTPGGIYGDYTTYRDLFVFRAGGSGNIGLYSWPALNEPDEVDAQIAPCLDTPYHPLDDFSNLPVWGASGRRYWRQDLSFTAKKGSVSGTLSILYERAIEDDGVEVVIRCLDSVVFSGKAMQAEE